MNLRVRRVITGHDPQNKAVVESDEVIEPAVQRPGQEACIIWTTDRVPADNSGIASGPDAQAGTVVNNGVAFRILRYEAGAEGRMHRTQSLDYGVILSGSIVLELDDDATVTLHAGDVLVQRGTIHKWINEGTEPCVMAFVLIDALQIEAADGNLA